MEIDEPDWQEMDKAVETINSAFECVGDLSDFASRHEMECLYIELRRLALNHARIPD